MNPSAQEVENIVCEDEEECEPREEKDEALIPITSKPPTLAYKSLGIPHSRIQNLEGLKDELTCPLCLMTVWEPVCCASCETHFCNICILEWLKNSVTCPVCQCVFESHQIPRISRNFLSKLRISCIYEENGCIEPCEYKDVYLHGEKCEYRKEKCLNEDCGLELTLRDLKEHREKCPHLLVSCQFCKNFLKNRDREAHEQECPYRPIICCNDGCGKTLKAIDYDRHLEDCDFKPFNCEFCLQTVIRAKLEPHIETCDEKPTRCKGCEVDLKLRDLKRHEDECELIEIRCETCEQRFLRKDQHAHDRLTCVEAGLQLVRKVLCVGVQHDEKKTSFLENNRLEIFHKRLEHQALEISQLKKDLLSLQMANLTDTKSSVYSLQYPDLPHKTVVLASQVMNPLMRKPSNSFWQGSERKEQPSFQDVQLVCSKTCGLYSPENISTKKHNYLSLLALNEALVLIGDDIGRLTLWDLYEDKELASVGVLSGVEVKAISLFAYDPAASMEELYGFIPRSDKTSLSLLGFWVITGHGSGNLFVWDIDLRSSMPGAVIKRVSQIKDTSNHKISSILDLEDQTHFITASYGKENQIEVWDCLSDQKVYSIEKPHKDTISKLVLLEKRSRFVSGSDDCTIKVWRIIRSPQTSKILSPQCEKTINPNEPIWSLAVYGNKLIVALNNFSLELYDLSNKERERRFIAEDDLGGLIGDLLIVDLRKVNEEEDKEKEGSAQGEFLIVALHKDRVCVYDGELKPLACLRQSQNEIKWGWLASHLMQILIARRLKEGGNLVKFAILGQKGKKISVLELTIF